MEWPTFLRAPLRRVLRRVSDDAPIDSTIDLASSFQAGEELLQLLRNVRDERRKVREVLSALDHLLPDAEHEGLRQPVAVWLGRLRDAVWDGEDALDELATDAAILHRQCEKQSPTADAEVWKSFSEKLRYSYELDVVRGKLEDLLEEGRSELGLREISATDDGAEHPPPPMDPGQLRAKFEQLAPAVKECFAYLSLLPKPNIPGIGIGKSGIIQLWIPQGFLDDECDGEQAVPLRGDRHLQAIISSSLIECQSLEIDDLTRSSMYTSDGEGDEPLMCTYYLSDEASDLAVLVSRDFSVMPDDDDLEAGKIPPADRVRHLSRVEYSSDLESLPAHVIGQYEKLRSFFLSDPNCKLMFPPGSDNFMRFLEEVAFTKFRRLRALRLSGVQLSELPASVDYLKLLRLLDLTVTPIKQLPASLGELYNLQVLLLSSCPNLTELPEGLFCDLINLRWLDVSFTPLLELPESLGEARNLQMLEITECDRLEKLPESIGNLTKLVALEATGTNLKGVPEGVGNLSSLRTLRLSATFEELPESMGELSNLEVLVIRSGNGMLKKMPESLRKLSNLTHLNLARSGLEKLPMESLSSLPKLREINLTDVDIEENPEDLAALRRLVNEKGVILWYYGKHTSVPTQDEEEAEGAAAADDEEGEQV